LRWARAAAGTRYVVVRSDEEIGEQASPQGRTGEGSMAEGTTVAGWGKVVYNGTGDEHLTGTWTAREFVVGEGSTNYFAVYGMTGDETTGFYFSAPTKPNAYKWETTNAATSEVTVHTAVDGSGVPVASSVAEGGWPCTTPKYEPGEGVDSFEYRTSVTEIGDTNPQRLALEFNYETRPETGSGWSGAWTGDTDKWKVHDGSLLSEGTHYPAPTGNKLYWHDTSTGAREEAKLTRQLKTPDSGEFFVAALMNYFEPHPETGALDKWIQVALVDAEGNDIVSFGMPGWNYIAAAIEYNGNQYCGSANIEDDGYKLNSGHGNDYVVVGQLSREAGKFRLWVYYGGPYNTGADQVTIPELYSKKENNVEVPVGIERTALNTVLADCDFAGTPAAVAGIQLRAGSESGKELGHVYFDEVRFANTWEELFLFNAPEVYTYDFDKPEGGTGRLDPENPTDEEGHRQWQISDGALAHGNVGLNAQFGLFHRTGIQSASFTILDSEGNQILMEQQDDAGKTAPEEDGTPASVDLTGAAGRTYSDWKTEAGGATGVAVPTNQISLDATYTVEVTLKSTGGKEATVTAASESGGVAATDLFFGEYGEGAERDKYVELYNASSERVDLRNYVLARGNNNETDPNYSNRTWYCSAYVAPKDGPAVYIEPRSTLVLLDPPFNTEDSKARRQELLKALGSLPSLEMSNDVLDSGGSVPIILMTAEAFEGADANGRNANSPVNKPWLDACGDSDAKVEERFIMSRKAETTPLPRKNLAVNLDEWDYRRWSFPKSGTGKVDDLDGGYTNFVATAGVYDRNIGLGGNMEFKVYDDDIEAPVLNGGGVKVGSRTVEGAPGDRTYVMGGWSFTNYPAAAEIGEGGLTLEQYQWFTELWPYGLTTTGGVSWSPLLGGRTWRGTRT
ncbi:MAG: hypothetical protein J6Y19_05465, partial [Kiritimatiellae bacterium]|nr:hypothetical protein [Kiritimatiellia bacterium]